MVKESKKTWYVRVKARTALSNSGGRLSTSHLFESSRGLQVDLSELYQKHKSPGFESICLHSLAILQ